VLVGGVQSFQRPQNLFVEQVVLLEGLPYLPRAAAMHPVEVQKVLQTRYRCDDDSVWYSVWIGLNHKTVVPAICVSIVHNCLCINFDFILLC
jgi:hypothetical protein